MDGVDCKSISDLYERLKSDGVGERERERAGNEEREKEDGNRPGSGGEQ